MHDGIDVSRRQVLISGGLAASAPLLARARKAPSLVRSAAKAGAPAPGQVHVQFGADAASQAAVSWAAPAANDDNPYINGYSRGLQRAWLERELAAASRDHDIDWIVVCMHQVAMSSAHFNGADLGIRQQFLPLFDRYGVDLVLAGHEHHFERTFPVRGTLPGTALLTPAPQGSNAGEIDTRAGTVHMIIGGGGPFGADAAQ